MINSAKLDCRPMAPGFALIAVILAFVLPLSAVVPQRGGMPRTQRHESHHEIFQLEETWRKAVLNSDAAAMSSLLADDYIGITAKGMLLTKEQTLARLRSGRGHYTSLDLADLKVRFYGTTALVTSFAQAAGVNAEGEDVTGSFRYTRVYVRNAQGQWKIVSFEASRIREAGEPK
jgi:ketosteroid isomerase-like protein